MSEEVADHLRTVLYHRMLAELGAMAVERQLNLAHLNVSDAWDDVALELRTPDDAFSLSADRLAAAFGLHPQPRA